MIQVSHLSKKFGTLTAVDDLTFEVQPGRVTGFLGPNGAGKTTTLRIGLDLVRADSGTVTFDGRHYHQLPKPMSHVGAALEATGFHPGRSARDHLLTMAPQAGVPDQRCDEVLELVGLKEAARKRVKGFSMGMRGRLSLAATLLADPQILLLDEPTNGLDPEGIAWMRGLLRHLADEGRTILISSHLLSEVQQTVDDVIIIGHGRLLHASPLADLARLTRQRTWVTPIDPKALLDLARQMNWTLERTPDPSTAQIVGPTPAEIGHACFAAGVELRQLAPQSQGLEDTFLALTHGQEAIR